MATTSTEGLRTVRAASTWSPANGLMYTRPWRSSPLARPAFSTLPPIIAESSEESLEDGFDPPDSPRELEQTQRSPSSSSIQSDTPATPTSGYGSRNTSGSASALLLIEGEASTSSVSSHASSSLHGSSHDLGNSQASSRRPARLLKSPGRRPSSAQARLSLSNVSGTSITPLPRARTVSYGHSRSASFSPQPIVSSPTPTIPQAYSPNSPSPQSETNAPKQPPSASRDPAANWMSSSPFGPAMTPKFSRLAMASPAVVMPLSAKEYRIRKAKELPGKDKEKESPTSSNHITFIDSTISQPLNGVPQLTVSPPPSEHVHPSSGGHGPDLRTQPQPQADHPPHASSPTQLQPQPSPSMAKHKRSHSRPNSSLRPSSLAAHPPISPKSSAGTFFSLVSTSSSDDDAQPQPPSHARGADDSNTTNVIPPARPRPSRRKSYPDRLSNSARFSLLEAMNRLSQESSSLHRLSVLSQTDDANRLSLASQTSGHTLFYDVESDGDGRMVSGGQSGNGNGGGGQQRTSILATQSLEDLSSSLARTGIEVVHPDSDGDLRVPLNDERKGKRNVRKVRISDTIEVSEPSEPRRRKLTKSRPSAHGSTLGAGTTMATANEMKVRTTQTHERRMSLLPWKLKGSSSDSKSSAVSARSGVAGVGAGEKRNEGGHPSTPTKGLVHPKETIAPPPILHSPALVANDSTYVESLTQTESSNPIRKPFFTGPMSTSSTTPRKTHRYSFPYLSSPFFHRPKREKSNTQSAGADPGPDRYTNTEGKPNEGSVKGVESGADSIRTITQGSQSTLTPESPGLYDLTTVASSGWGTTSPVMPMLRRLNAQATAAGVPPQGEWDGKGDSTPSLITNENTASIPRAITLSSLVRLPGEELFVPRPSGLKESFTDTIEEEDIHTGEERERTPGVRVHRKQDQRSSARACGVEISEEDEWVDLRRRSSSGLSMSLSPSPRPGTPSSTLTTATETSGSYISYSTIPCSTTSSSTSPSLMMSDKRDRMVSVPLGGGCKSGGGQVCTCGQLVPPSMSPTRERNRAEMHPMFTVPLVTVPASATSVAGTHSRAGADMGGGARYVGRRKSGRHLSVPVSAAVRVGVATARNGQAHHVNGGVPVPTVSAVSTTTKTTTSVSLSQSSTQKVKKHRRPQTAPPGTGDAASKFIEDTMMLRARERTVDGHVSVGIGGDHSMKHKVRGGSGESKFKTVLKGLLRWHG